MSNFREMIRSAAVLETTDERLLRVVSVIAYGEDEHAGLVWLAVTDNANIDATDVFHVLALAEDVFVHPFPAVAALAADEWMQGVKA